MLKAVLMDIDDTLLDFGKCAEQAMRIGFAEWGLPYDDSTYATFTRINDGLWLMIERGELTTQQLFEFRWNRIFEALGIQADGAAFEQRFLALLYETYFHAQPPGRKSFFLLYHALLPPPSPHKKTLRCRRQSARKYPIRKNYSSQYSVEKRRIFTIS